MSDIFEPKTPHFNIRKPTMIIIHGIGVEEKEAHDLFTGNSLYEASTHYFIKQDGTVIQYVDETARAFHAGVSYWGGITDINSISLGIELESRPIISEEKDFCLTFYPEKQLDALAELVKGMCERHRIPQANILAHQDIAPYRKYDPGINFNWRYFSEKGLGLWHGLEEKEDRIVTDKNEIERFKKNLIIFGYDPRPDANGNDFSRLIKAFQTHFLPWNDCGQVTEQSIEALDILLRQKFGF